MVVSMEQKRANVLPYCGQSSRRRDKTNFDKGGEDYECDGSGLYGCVCVGGGGAAGGGGGGRHQGVAELDACKEISS